MSLTETQHDRTTPSDPAGAVRTWLEENWDPDLTVAQWWEKLGIAGWEFH